MNKKELRRGSQGPPRAPPSDVCIEHGTKCRWRPSRGAETQPELLSEPRAQGRIAGENAPVLLSTKALSAANATRQQGCNRPEGRPFLFYTKSEYEPTEAQGTQETINTGNPPREQNRRLTDERAKQLAPPGWSRNPPWRIGHCVRPVAAMGPILPSPNSVHSGSSTPLPHTQHKGGQRWCGL